MRKLYKIKHIFIGHRIYKLTNGFSIRVNINVKEIRKSMTRNEAMAFAISVGKPIRHKSFSKGEFVRYKGKELVDEEGTILPQQEFWAIRSGGSWENGWEEYKDN